MQLNYFETPQYYREQMLKQKLLNFEKEQFKGKSLACLFLTRFCGVGCSFCFFKSAPSWRKRNIEDQFNNEGIEKFITFSKKANLGYLLVSGGGEPLNQRKHIIRLIEGVESDRIVLVTSGNWGKNYEAALGYLQEIYGALQKRKTQTHVVLRVSVSQYHILKLGLECATNIADIFDKYFPHTPNFSLQIKTFEGDLTLGELIEKLEAQILPGMELLASDNNLLQKLIPKKIWIRLKRGYKLPVGISRVFYSNIKANLLDEWEIEKGIKVMEEDLEKAENYYSSVVFNQKGSHNLNWSVSYNGNVCTWQNQSRDTYKNLYEDNYEEVLESCLEDPLSYSLIDKGNIYRENIVNEINPRAVLRAKAIGLRDAVGAILFEEEKTRLYYTVRVVQDYIHEKKILPREIQKWPIKLQALISTSKERLQELYLASRWNIIEQQKQKPFDQTEWYDFLELIKLGHYALSAEEIQDALVFYNRKTSRKIEALDDIESQTGEVIRRLTERLMHIKAMEIELEY